MHIFYSPANRGFYAVDVHGDAIPADAVPIASAEYTALLSAQAGGMQIVAGPGGLPTAVPQAPPAAPSPIRVIRSLAFRERLPEHRRKAITGMAIALAVSGDAELLNWLMDQAAGGTTDLDDPRVQSAAQALYAANVITEAERDALLADGTPSET